MAFLNRAERSRHHELSLEWDTDESGVIAISAPCGCKAGDPDAWCPEELLLASLGLSLMTTFLSLAAKAQLRVARYQGRASGLIRESAGHHRFEAFSLEATVRVGQPDTARARCLLDRAARRCVSSADLEAPVDFYPRVVGVRPRTRFRLESPDPASAV